MGSVHDNGRPGLVPERFIIGVRVSADDVKMLLALCGDGPDYVASNVGEFVEYLARSAAEGVRRPGSWERDWVQKATGPLGVF